MEEKKKPAPDESPKWPHWPSVAIPEQVRWSWFGKIVLTYGFCLVVGGSSYLLVNLFLFWWGWFTTGYWPLA